MADWVTVDESKTYLETRIGGDAWNASEVSNILREQCLTTANNRIASDSRFSFPSTVQSAMQYAVIEYAFSLFQSLDDGGAAEAERLKSLGVANLKVSRFGVTFRDERVMSDRNNLGYGLDADRYLKQYLQGQPVMGEVGKRDSSKSMYEGLPVVRTEDIGGNTEGQEDVL